jgi:hypothetical protein
MVTQFGEAAEAFFNANLTFYYESPVVAATGYLLVCAAPVIFLLLRFALKMTALDNDRVKGACEFELKKMLTKQQAQRMRVED